jgi:hypothetical protein
LRFFPGHFWALISGLLLAISTPARAQRDYIQPVPISPSQLIDAYQTNFHEADAKYTGKLLLVTGRIKTLRLPDRRTYRYWENKVYAFATLDTGRNLPLAVYFWDWQAQGLNTLRTGATVTVMGFCEGVPPQLSLNQSCLYPKGCGGPKSDFYGPYFKTPPSPVPSRRRP